MGVNPTGYENALVIAPHADDESFGCGGTIAKLASQGVEVNLLLGSLGYDKESACVHQEELEKAIKILGIANYSVLNTHGERYQDQMGQFYLTSHIEAEISKRYGIVFIPYPSHHQDHIAIHQACLAALRPGTFQPSLILMYEYTYPTWVVPDQYNGRMFVDIDDTMIKKAEAIQVYQSQYRGPLSPVSARAAIIMAQTRGLSIGVTFAEMFYIIQTRDIL